MKESTKDSKQCNCRQKKNNYCPLDGKCLTKCVVYEATVTVTTSNNQETYIRLTENEHRRDSICNVIFQIRTQEKFNNTFAITFGNLKKNNNKSINFNIKWEVVKKVKAFAPGEKVRKLCLQEKLSILRSAPSLNYKKKTTKFLDIACIRNDSISTKTTIHFQLMRFPLCTESLILYKNNIG